MANNKELIDVVDAELQATPHNEFFRGIGAQTVLSFRDESDIAEFALTKMIPHNLISTVLSSEDDYNQGHIAAKSPSKSRHLQQQRRNCSSTSALIGLNYLYTRIPTSVRWGLEDLPDGAPPLLLKVHLERELSDIRVNENRDLSANEWTRFLQEGSVIIPKIMSTDQFYGFSDTTSPNNISPHAVALVSFGYFEKKLFFWMHDPNLPFGPYPVDPNHVIENSAMALLLTRT